MFPHYNPIHRTSSTFISCPSFVQMSFSILMQFSFSVAITGAFPHVKNLCGFKVTRCLWSGWLFLCGFFHQECFQCFSMLFHVSFFHWAFRYITTFIIWVIFFFRVVYFILFFFQYYHLLFIKVLKIWAVLSGTENEIKI